MTTGYTIPIVRGEVTEFKDYVKICMRAFGACSHLRDEPLVHYNYKGKEPNEYNLKEMAKAQEDLIKLRMLVMI